MTIKRFGYYVFLSIAGLFFLAQLIIGPSKARLNDGGLISSTALMVMFLVLYISKMDKAYLICSIPLRVIMCVTGILGVILVVTSIGH